jgi:hypothetical protein
MIYFSDINIAVSKLIANSLNKLEYKNVTIFSLSKNIVEDPQA